MEFQKELFIPGDAVIASKYKTKKDKKGRGFISKKYWNKYIKHKYLTVKETFYNGDIITFEEISIPLHRQQLEKVENPNNIDFTR